MRCPAVVGRDEELAVLAEIFGRAAGGRGACVVVTEFEFRLYEVSPVVRLGLLFWGLREGRSLLRLARATIATLPRGLNIVLAGLNAPAAPFVPEQHRLQPGYALVIVGFGPASEHDRVVTRIRQALPPLWEFVTPMPYVAVQQMLDGENTSRSYKGTYLEDLSDEAIEVVVEYLPRKNSPQSLLLFYRLDEAYSEVGDDDTAFSGGRSPRFAVFIVAVCPTPQLLAADRAWTRAFWEALRPHSLGAGSYVNAMTEFEDDRVRAAYGPAKYERLARIKGRYDPRNLFHHNANIQPA